MIILHYIPSIAESSGGVGSYIQLLARDLGKLCELHIVTHQWGDELPMENCMVHFIPLKWLPWNSCKSQFLQILDEVKPDVFHTNSCWLPVSALSAIWAKKKGYKVVYTPHGMLEPYSFTRHYWTKKVPAMLLFQKKGVAVCDLVHTTSEKERIHVNELGWNAKLCVIPNSVQIDNIPMKSSWKKKKNILFIGRIHEVKGLEFLLETVALLKKELTDYKVSIAGPGEDEYISFLKHKADSLGIKHIINFIGPAFGDAKWGLYTEADLFILPSHTENFGIVIAEALASGTPVITTTGTPWEELNTEHCGWWIDQSVENIAQAIRQFLTLNDSELEIMGRNGRSLIERKYSSQAIAKQFMEMYEALRY